MLRQSEGKSQGVGHTNFDGVFSGSLAGFEWLVLVGDWTRQSPTMTTVQVLLHAGVDCQTASRKYVVSVLSLLLSFCSLFALFLFCFFLPGPSSGATSHCLSFRLKISGPNIPGVLSSEKGNYWAYWYPGRPESKQPGNYWYTGLHYRLRDMQPIASPMQAAGRNQ